MRVNQASRQHSELVLVRLTDLRASLESKLRSLNAAEACVTRHRTHPELAALCEADRHLQAIHEQHASIGGAIADTRAALHTLIKSLSPPRA